MKQVFQPAMRRNNKTMPVLMFLGFSVLFFFMFYFMASIMFPFLLTVIIAYLLSPVALWLENKGIPRSLAAFLVLLFVLGSVFSAVFIALPALLQQLQDFVGDLPHFQQKLLNWKNVLQDKISFIEWDSLQRDLFKMINFKNIMGYLPGLLQDLFTMIYFLVIIPFLLFFFIKDGRRIIHGLLQTVSNRYFELIAFMVHEIDINLGRFLRGIFIQNTIIGFLAITGLSIIGMKNAILIGTLIGITNVIPYMGPTIGFILATVFLMAEPAGNPSWLAVIFVIAVVQLTDNMLVYPLAIGKSVHLHPVYVIASLLIGGFFLGVVGMLLAVPIVTSLHIVFKTWMNAVEKYRI